MMMMSDIKQKLKALEKNDYLVDTIPTRADNNKIPDIAKDWPNHKTSSADIDNWKPGQGIGVVCRRVVAVDIDIEHDAESAQAIQEIAEKVLGFAPRRVGKEPKRLLPYRLTGKPLKKKTLKFTKDGIEEKIEILGEKQHFVCYGTHPETKQPYTWHGGEICDIHIDELSKVSEQQLDDFLKHCEAYLVERGYSPSVSRADSLQTSQDRKSIGDPSLMSDPDLIKDALSYIPNSRDDEQTEIRTHDDLIPYVAAIKAALGGKSDHYSIYRDWMLQWNDNTDEYIKARWDSIQDSQVGAEFIFTKAEKFGWINPEPEWVKKFNRDHFVTTEGKESYVFIEHYDPSFKRRALNRLSFTGFRNLYSNDKFKKIVNGQAKYIAKAKAWLEHPKRRTYLQGLTFCPGKDSPEGYYNLWGGFGIAPKAGSWEQMKIHIRDVLCAGDIELFNYTIGWLANMVQNPDRQGEVAFVISGGKGVGKGTFGHYVGKFFGQHFLHVTNQKHLIGNFNNHLRDAVFVVLDEAFFAGDKKHESILKSIITEPVLMIEKKGIDAIQSPNYTHIMMFSNETWVVPASVDERRFFVLHVSSDRKPDRAHFDALYAEMDNGGPAAMLDYLMKYDLSDFDLRSIPQTSALIEQKLQSLGALEKWLYSCLYDGYIGGFAWDNERFLMRTQTAYHDYTQHHKAHSYEGKPLIDATWSKTIRKVLFKNDQPLIIDGGKPTDDNGYRLPHTSFPALTEAREAFERYIGGKIEWPPNDPEITLDDLLE